MGSHGNALAVSFFRRRARLRSGAHDFHYTIEKRCGKVGRYVSFNEIHLILFSVSMRALASLAIAIDVTTTVSVVI